MHSTFVPCQNLTNVECFYQLAYAKDNSYIIPLYGSSPL